MAAGPQDLLSASIRVIRGQARHSAICNLKLSEAWKLAGHDGSVARAASVVNLKTLSPEITGNQA